MILRVLAGAFGGVAFGLLFGVPKKYFLSCGLSAGAGWLVYSILSIWLGNALSTLVASMVMAFVSRICAIIHSCPSTVFLMSGTVPLVPGAKVFWMTYYMVMGHNYQIMNNGLAALKAAGAIVLGIVLIFEIPGRVFQVLAGGKHS